MRFTQPRSLCASDARVGDQMAFRVDGGLATEWLFDAKDADAPDTVWTVVSSIDGGGILRFRFTNGYFEEFFEAQRVVIREQLR